jgi:hypothetical protein
MDRVQELEAIGVEEIVVSPWVLPFAVREPEGVETIARRVIAPLHGTG